MASDIPSVPEMCDVVVCEVVAMVNIKMAIQVFSPTVVQLDSLKNNLKFALKLTLKSSYMFWCETPSSESTLSEPC
jgi:hypothetical protein